MLQDLALTVDNALQSGTRMEPEYLGGKVEQQEEEKEGSGVQDDVFGEAETNVQSAQQGPEREQRHQQRQTTEAETVAETNRVRVSRLVARILFLLEPDVALGYTGPSESLPGFLDHVRLQLQVETRKPISGQDACWEACTLVWALLQSLGTCEQGLLSRLQAPRLSSEDAHQQRLASPSPSSPSHQHSTSPVAFAWLLSHLATTLQHTHKTRQTTWGLREQKLRLAVREAELVLAAEGRQISFLDRLVFNQKVLSFSHSLKLFCRLQLPPSVTRTAPDSKDLLASSSSSSSASLVTSSSSSSLPSASSSKALKQNASMFECRSTDGFVKEFRSFPLFGTQEHRKLGAQVYHFFLQLVQKKVEEDVELGGRDVVKPKQKLQCDLTEDSKKRDESEGEREGEGRVQRAMDTIELTLCSRLFSVMFPGDRSSLSFRDEELVWKLKSLDWLEPKHVDLPHVDGAHNVWFHPVEQLRQMELLRCPQHKLCCVVKCMKWLAKLLEAQARKSSTPVDADTFLSGLIFALVLARPSRIFSSLEYIEVFTPTWRLLGEERYCLTQLSLAVEYVANTLVNQSKESIEAAQAAEAEKEMSQNQKHLSGNKCGEADLGGTRAPSKSVSAHRTAALRRRSLKSSDLVKATSISLIIPVGPDDADDAATTVVGLSIVTD